MNRGTALSSLVSVAVLLPGFTLAACSGSQPTPFVPPVNPPPTDVTPGDTPGGTDDNGGGADASGPPAPTPVYNTQCNLTGELAPPPPMTLKRVMGQHTMTKPVDIVPSVDGSNRTFIVSQPGQIFVTGNLDDGSAPQSWLDMRSLVDDTPNEGGLLGLAFAPDFATSGHFYVSYTRTQAGQFESAVTRLTANTQDLATLATNPLADAPEPQTPLVVLTQEQPYGNHNSGPILMGPDGMLYIALGDGGWKGDPLKAGQDLNTWLAKILRIDVSQATAQAPYSVPTDNPFVGVAGARPEIWAYGLRNPWRCSFDVAAGQGTGALWCGDVGQDAYEEIDIIVRGGNYGWNAMEGTHCYPIGSACEPDGYIPPVVEYPHAEGKSVTGGMVYRGSAMPTLVGTYLMADYAFGTVWGVAPGPDGAWQRQVLGNSDLFISAFGADPAGEVLLADWKGGGLYRLEPQDPDAPGTPGWPLKLSETGCFDDLATRELAPGMVPYTVNSPLWSDHADKLRAFGLPEGGVMTVNDAGSWELPVGTVLLKHFELAGTAIETRFMVRADSGWRAATYQWNADGTDAVLLSGPATTTVQGPAGEQVWEVPSRGECMACHTEAAGRVLGWETAQLDRQVDHYGAQNLGDLGQVSQLATLMAAGYLDRQPVSPGAWAAANEGSADLEMRARAYLHANCAHCHRPGGLGNATFDLDYRTSLADSGMCDVDPQQGDLGVGGAKILAAGDKARSVLWLRMLELDGAVRMPNLASSVVDDAGVQAVGAWIDTLTGCE